MHPIEDPTGCSLYTHFLQYAWMHKPETLLERDFWPAVQTEAQSFTKHEGWWPHILWQALFGEWCGGSAVVLCLGMAYHMATMHEHIRTRIEFEAMGARCRPVVPTATVWLV